MAEIMDDVVHLSQEIGPHPAGTEEEQQAALYLAEEIQKESGFPAVIEDFQYVTNYLIPSLVCFGVALVAVIVSIVLPIAVIPCFIAVALATALFACELFQKPVLSRFLRTGASQNVVAKYQPTPLGGVARRRKVILVANYDTGKVLKEEELPFAGILPYIQKASAIALALATLLLFLRMTLFATDTGALSSIITMLLVVCAVLFVIPLIRAALHLAAPYSQSANNNAAGVSVLLDVARQVGNGLVSNEEAMERAKQEGTYVHGESAAREAGLVPEGASLEYDSQVNPQESLAAAKAAIAALTGKPVADKVPVTDISSRLVKGGGLEPVDKEAISSVHFEVSETPQVRSEKPGRFRTMVSMEEENFDSDTRADEQLSPRDRVEHRELEENQAADAQRMEMREQNLSESPEEIPASSFERPAPLSTLNNGAAVASTAFSGSVDKTPAWAKAAQAKARKNKPEESQPHRVARSRYADTVAAHLMENQNERQRQVEAERVYKEAQTQEQQPLSDNPELASRLAALRSEIELTEAPHISASTQAALNSMEVTAEEQSPIQAEQQQEVVVSTQPAKDMPAEQQADSFEENVSKQEVAKNNVVLPVEEKEESRITVSSEEIIPSNTSNENTRSVEESEENSIPSSSRTGLGRGGSQPLRKAAGLSRSFTSRLKSITNHKQEESVSSTEYDGSFDDNLENPVRKRDVVSGDATEQLEKEQPLKQTPSIQEEVTAPEVPAPNKTAAISPIDVSRFMDKEKEKEEAYSEEEAFDESSFYGVSGYEPQDFIDQRVDAAETQKVSSERIQEAIQEASSHEPVIEPAPENKEAPVASPIVGMESMIPQIPLNARQEEKDAPKRQVIVLPDVMAPHTNAAEGSKQRAPMAETNESTKAGSKALLSNMLPRIDGAESTATEGDKKDSFGLNLPSLGEETNKNSAVSATGSFSTVGATGSLAPVGDELVADIDPEERYIDDADDSAYDEDYTETGAYAGRGYVDMPKSRAGRLFGKFRKKKKNKQDEVSVNDWVDVDDSYDARSVGKARGDWSSFRQEETDNAQATTQVPRVNNDSFVDIDYHDTDFDNRRGWNGGAFSLSRLKKSRGSEMDLSDSQESMDVYEDQGYSEGEDNLVEVNPAVRMDGDRDTAEQINRELRKLQDFRHPDIDTEVWFVALGSEQYSHSGITAFLDEHADEMKGAVIINLEALGAGTLSIIEQESSTFKTYRPSSRIKRFVRQASERSGVTYRTSPLGRRDTPATVAMARGIQAFTVAGMGDGNTALYSAENDIVENIDPEAMKDASKFVMAILKSI